MTGKLDYRWHLRTVMANAGMYSTSSLGPLLAERGINLSTSQVYRLVTEKPERLNLKVLMALLDILNCSMDDLVEPVALSSNATKSKKAADGGSTAGVGDYRPKPCPHRTAPIMSVFGDTGLSAEDLDSAVVTVLHRLEPTLDPPMLPAPSIPSVGPR